MNLHLPKLSSAHAGQDARLNPSRDWFVLLGVAFALLLCSVAGNLWLFHAATQDRGIGDGSIAAEAEELNLDSVRALFAEREAERARYIQGYGFTDPSR